MRNYAKAAVVAHGIIIKDSLTPLDAWNKAISSITSSLTARNKGCPRATFLALAENGYLKDVNVPTSVNRVGILHKRAIAAANLVLSNPDATHSYLSDKLKYVDKQGSYDIVIELVKSGILQPVR